MNSFTYTIDVPNHKSVLIINKGFYISFLTNRPNWFWRMMQYLFFGFKWERIQLNDLQNRKK